MIHQNSFALAEAISPAVAQSSHFTNESNFSRSVGSTDDQAALAPASCETLAESVFKVKARLQQRYEQVFPDLGDIICYVIDEEERSARKWSSDLPHLALPALVESHMALLGLGLLPEGQKNEVRPPAFVLDPSESTGAVERFV